MELASLRASSFLQNIKSMDIQNKADSKEPVFG
jgi:hypothetical protein